MVFLDLRKTQLPYEICKSILGMQGRGLVCACGYKREMYLLQSTAVRSMSSSKLLPPSKKELSESGTCCRH